MDITAASPTGGSKDGAGLDEPQGDPSRDLLDMDKQAQALARYIRQHNANLPFTVGVFGEWGEGKTTLVQFLRRHLCEGDAPPGLRTFTFVRFSAWPFTTSDKLWRALVLEIAQVLYGKKSTHDQEPRCAGPESPSRLREARTSGLGPALARFFANEVVLRSPPAEPDPYQELLDKMDEISYGAIGKKSGNLQLDQEATMAAVIKGAVTALSTVSPLVAGLRGLLGIEATINVAELVKQESKGINEATRGAIEALPKFQDLFREMLRERAGGKALVVFIDDLDRCQPDVALDLLESIRIALAEVECVFVIALDVRLIAQGLRLRYPGLFANEPTPGAFRTKGQEYLEKIIQFSVRVPPRAPGQAQRFIAAQFPRWMASGDIIQTIIGDNPRRLKQYCQRLTFQDMVAPLPGMPGPDEDNQTAGNGAAVQLFHRLVQLYQWEPDLLPLIAQLAGSPDDFAANLRAIEDGLQPGDPGVLAAPPTDQPAEAARAELYGTISRSQPLQDLFRSPSSPMSDASADQVALLARLASIEPDRDKMLSTQDRVFARVLDGVSKRSLTGADQLMAEDLEKVITLYEGHRDLADELAMLADSPHLWHAVLPELEAGAVGGGLRVLPDDIARVVQRWRNLLDPSPPTPYLAPPSTPAMSRRLVRIALHDRPMLDQMLKALPSAEPRSALALERLREQEAIARALDRIVTELELQIALARHLMAVRSFVKLDAFVYQWPEAARLAMTRYSSLVAFETHLLQAAAAADPAGPSFPEAEARELYDRYAKDEQFVRFLRIRPYFSEIDEEELNRYQPAQPVLIEAPETASPLAANSPPTHPSAEATARVGRPRYQTVTIRFQRKSDGDVGGSPTDTTAPGESAYRVVINTTKNSTAARELWELMLKLMGADASRPDLAALFGSGRDYREQMMRVGAELSRVIGEVPLEVLANAPPDQRVRVVVEMDDPDLVQLPWEWLTLPGKVGFLFQNPLYSLVRSLPGSPPPTFQPPLQLPLRVLAVLVQAPGRPTTDALENTFRTMQTGGAADVHLLTGSRATLEALFTSASSFQPHVIHFEVPIWHQALDSLEPANAEDVKLVLSRSDNETVLLGPDTLRQLLKDSNVRLIVFGSSAGATAPSSPLVKLASHLVSDGTIGAAIVPLRGVMDPDAQAFSRELYRSLVSGRPLETAICEARRTLSARGMDWSAFGLWANNIRTLDDLQLPAQP